MCGLCVLYPWEGGGRAPSKRKEIRTAEGNPDMGSSEVDEQWHCVRSCVP
jgi:hypothetical protein